MKGLPPTLCTYANACVLVFDCTQASTFETLGKQQEEFLTNAEIEHPHKFPFIVIGNKVDNNDRQVSRQQAEAWCQSVGGNVTYFETSAMSGENVNRAFLSIAAAGFS